MKCFTNSFKLKNLLFFLSVFILFNSCMVKQPVLKLGLVADPQYASKATSGNRYYKESLRKLEEATDTFNYYNVDFVQNLGDIIDTEWESFDSVLPVYDKLNPEIENYHLLGNHDFSIDSTFMGELLVRLSMPDYYYSYSKIGWRFIVLDATDFSYYSNSLHHHDLGRVDYYYEYSNGKANNHLWNSAIGEKQQNWLKKELDSANALNQKVILFSHLPVKPEGDAHNLWNAAEIINLIEDNSNVVAFINGHNHSGGYEFSNGVHYITISGMVETMNNSFGILEIHKDSMVLQGFGNQKSIHMSLEE